MKGSKWFTVNYPYASQLLKDVVDKYDQYLQQGRKQAKFTLENFTHSKMSNLFIEMIDNGLNKIPKQVQLTLPKLKKVEA